MAFERDIVESAGTVWNRIRALSSARLQALWRTSFLHSSPLWLHAVFGAAFALLLRGELGPRAYATAAFALTAVLVSLPLVGELGLVLRIDPAREWVETLPLKTSEARLARLLLALIALGALALASLFPAALLAPSGATLGFRLRFVLAGLCMTLAFAGPLLFLQGVLRGRARGGLVLTQTLLVVAALVGAVAGSRNLLRLAPLDEALRHLPALPTAWWAVLAQGRFESAAARNAGLLALGTTLFSSALLLFAPPSAESDVPRGGAGLVDRVLQPLRAFALRLWVRKDERGAFELVWSALPLEREFVLRTYPLLGIPLAFLLLGARGTSGVEREGLLALLLFTPAVLFPVLLAHVPATSAPDASWLLRTAPCPPEAHASGALKALAVRFVAPLYLMLGALSLSLAGADFTLRLAPLAAAINLVVLRLLYPTCVGAPPLSQKPDEIETKGDLAGTLLALAFGLTLLSALAYSRIPSTIVGLPLAGLVLAVELSLGARRRSQLVSYS